VRNLSTLPHNHVLLAIADTRMTGATLVNPRAGTWNDIGATHHNRRVWRHRTHEAVISEAEALSVARQ